MPFVMQGEFRGADGEVIELYGEGMTIEEARDDIGWDLYGVVGDWDEYESGNAYLDHCISVELIPGPCASYELWSAIQLAARSITTAVD